MGKKILNLQPQKVSASLLSLLEEKGLIKLLKPTNRIENNPQRDAVDLIYSSAPEFGPHKLICVRKNVTDIAFAVHSENEEIILINMTGKKFKPLFLIVGLDQVDVFEEKIKKGVLSEKDIMVLELEYNKYDTCIFTVLKNVPHYEVTTRGDADEAPVFYVTEPASMDMRLLDTSGYGFELTS